MAALSTQINQMEQKVENKNNNFIHVSPSPLANFPPAQRLALEAALGKFSPMQTPAVQIFPAESEYTP